VLAVHNHDSFIRHTHAEHSVTLDMLPHHMSRWNADVFRGLGLPRLIRGQPLLVILPRP
jgi:hypothetical protein